MMIPQALILITLLMTIQIPMMTQEKDICLFDQDGVVDTTYENIARGDGELYSESTTVEDLIIRAYSIIASIDERDTDKRLLLSVNLSSHRQVGTLLNVWSRRHY